MNKCKVCMHQDREEIDKALIENKLSNRMIATQYGLSESSIRRHKENHLPQELIKAKEAKDIAKADNLLDRIRELQTKTERILDTAEERGDLRTCLMAIREARENIELLAKLLGELQEGLTVNILSNSEWINLRAIILEVLEPYPEVKDNLVRRLNELEG